MPTQQYRSNNFIQQMNDTFCIFPTFLIKRLTKTISGTKIWATLGKDVAVSIFTPLARACFKFCSSLSIRIRCFLFSLDSFLNDFNWLSRVDKDLINSPLSLDTDVAHFFPTFPRPCFKFRSCLSTRLRCFYFSWIPFLTISIGF